MPRRPLRINRAASAGGAFAALAVACALMAACSSSVGGTGTLASTPTPTPTTSATKATPTNTRTSSPDFPSTSATTSKPPTSAATTSTTGGNAALKASLADLGANWMHAYANGDEAQFCALSDPATLQAVFNEKGIGSCSELNIDWSSDPDLQSQIAGFSIPDPQKIAVSGTKATVSASNVKPAGLTSMSWIQQSDQTWKVDASILAS